MMHKSTSLPRLRPYPVRGVSSCGGICVNMLSCTSAAFCQSSSNVLRQCNTEVRTFSEVKSGVYSNRKTTAVSTAVSDTVDVLNLVGGVCSS